MPKLTLGYMRVSETDECETKAALRKETPQLKKSQKASKDKDTPERPADGVYGQLLAEEWEEIKNSLTTNHKITNLIRKAGERWRCVPADERQKMNAW